jgi:hypothetical protein
MKYQIFCRSLITGGCCEALDIADTVEEAKAKCEELNAEFPAWEHYYKAVSPPLTLTDKPMSTYP